MLRFLYGMQKYKTRRISLGGKSYNAIIADSSTKRAIGLMFRKSLPNDSCMLFLFGFSGQHAIWMYNMELQIDAVWLDEKGVVVDAKTNLKPSKSMFGSPQYAPKAEARYLVELNAGEVKKQRIKAGSRARL